MGLQGLWTNIFPSAMNQGSDSECTTFDFFYMAAGNVFHLMLTFSAFISVLLNKTQYPFSGSRTLIAAATARNHDFLPAASRLQAENGRTSKC